MSTKNNDLLLIVGAGALLALAMRKAAEMPTLDAGFTGYSSDAGDYTQEASPVRNFVSSFLPRGIRNNNPGNIRRSGDAWQGLAPDQSDPEFFRFTSMADGVRAMVVILRNYARRHNLRTVAGIINRWAPPVENDTAGYAAVVARALGVNPWDTVNMDDADTLQRLTRAMIRMENGAVASLLVSDEAIAEGVYRALQA